jgi:Uma2 family endonuclease
VRSGEAKILCMRNAIASATPLGDDFVYALSRAIPEYRFERSADGGLIVAPNHTEGGRQSGEAYYQLRQWMERTGAGGQVFDSSAGFRLPDGSLVAANAAWLSSARIASLATEHRSGYWHVAPDVAIAVSSPSDRWSDATAKIDAYAENGTTYAIAIDGTNGATYERGTPPPGLALTVDAIVSR